MKGWKSFEIDAQTQRSTLISQRSTGGPGCSNSTGGGGCGGGMPQRTRSVEARNLPSSSSAAGQQHNRGELALMQQLPQLQPQQQQQQQQQQGHQHRPSICNDNNVLLNAETLSDERTQALMLAVLVTMVRNTTDENESRILYEYLAEASVVFPKVFPVIHSLIDAKINYVLANCHDHVILNAVHSIIQNMICTEEPSQQQLSYLQSIGFGGLWRFSGQFTKANQNKDHAEHFVNLLEAMVETYLPPDDLELRPAFRLNIAAGGRNMSGSLSSLSLGSLQSPTEKMGQRCSAGGQSDLLTLNSVSAASGAAAAAGVADHSTSSSAATAAAAGALASRIRHGSTNNRLIRQGSASSGTQISDLSPTTTTTTTASTGQHTNSHSRTSTTKSALSMATAPNSRPPPLVKISQDSFQQDELPMALLTEQRDDEQQAEPDCLSASSTNPASSSVGESLYNRAAGGHVNPLMARGLPDSQD